MTRMKYLLTRWNSLHNSHAEAVINKNLDRARRLSSLLEKVVDQLDEQDSHAGSGY